MAGGAPVDKFSGTDTSAFCGFDGNGNLGQLVDTSDGTLLSRYEYDPYGREIRATGTLADWNRIRFSTKYLDPESELYYYGYRFYSPGLGRWTSSAIPGPLAPVAAWGMVRNNPTSFASPRGGSEIGAPPPAHETVRGSLPPLEGVETRTDTEILRKLSREVQEKMDSKLALRIPEDPDCGWDCSFTRSEVVRGSLDIRYIGYHPLSEWRAVGESAISGGGGEGQPSVEVAYYERDVLLGYRNGRNYEAIVSLRCVPDRPYAFPVIGVTERESFFREEGGPSFKDSTYRDNGYLTGQLPSGDDFRWYIGWPGAGLP